jgi:hypothetical protein
MESYLSSLNLITKARRNSRYRVELVCSANSFCAVRTGTSWSTHVELKRRTQMVVAMRFESSVQVACKLAPWVFALGSACLISAVKELLYRILLVLEEPGWYTTGEKKQEAMERSNCIHIRDVHQCKAAEVAPN